MDRKKYAERAFRMEASLVRERVQNALLLAGVTMFVCLPMYYYQYGHFTREVFDKVPTGQELRAFALGQALILFATAFLCALMGFLYTERLSLPGLGDFRELKKLLPLMFAGGLLLAPFAYYFADRQFMVQIPEAYPDAPGWSLSWAAGSALSQEVVARFGLVSMGVYLLRWRGFSGHPWPAVAAVSLFAVFCSLLFLERSSFSAEVGLLQGTAAVAGVFGFQWALSEAYLRKGLLAALALHFGFSSRLIFYSFVF